MEDLAGGGGMIPASSRQSRPRRFPLGDGPSSSSLKATRFNVPDLELGREDLKFKLSVVA
jgi:hypothetical protein